MSLRIHQQITRILLLLFVLSICWLTTCSSKIFFYKRHVEEVILFFSLSCSSFRIVSFYICHGNVILKSERLYELMYYILSSSQSFFSQSFFASEHRCIQWYGSSSEKSFKRVFLTKNKVWILQSFKKRLVERYTLKDIRSGVSFPVGTRDKLTTSEWWFLLTFLGLLERC